MINQEVIIYLNTPLIQINPKAGGIQKIRAKVVSQDAGGIFVTVKELADGKAWLEELQGLKKLFIPYHKIDFISLE
ncbi:MAG: hypothetical protein Q7T11_06780 [Deltaproteobacteria bacterium]|nr:hypothetical protein [Deltaproteobacteria bacterium]